MSLPQALTQASKAQVWAGGGRDGHDQASQSSPKALLILQLPMCSLSALFLIGKTGKAALQILFGEFSSLKGHNPPTDFSPKKIADLQGYK